MHKYGYWKLGFLKHRMFQKTTWTVDPDFRNQAVLPFKIVQGIVIIDCYTLPSTVYS